MPPASRKKRKVENPVTSFHGESEIIGDAAHHHEGEAEDDLNVLISTTKSKDDDRSNARKERFAVIRIERNSQLDRRAMREKKKKAESWRCSPPPNVQGSSSSFSSGLCFICGCTTHQKSSKNDNHQARRLRLMRVNMFKDAAQEVLGNSYSMSPSAETCEECVNIVEQVWDLQHHIILIKEELHKIITEAVNQGGRKDLDKGRRRLGLEMQSMQDLDDENEDDYFPSTDESTNVEQNHSPVVEIVKEEPTSVSDLELHEDSMDSYNGNEDDPVSPGIIQEAEMNNGGRQKRRSRIKAEEFLRARREDDKHSESEEENSEFGVSKKEPDDTSDDDKQYSTDSEVNATSKPKPRHNSSERVRCSQCDATFATIKLKQNHIKRVHEKRKSFPCSSCDKRFFTSSDLKRHVLAKHEVKKINNPPLTAEPIPIRCDICDIRFSTTKQKRSHIKRIHENQRPFPCTLCDKRFVTRTELKRHGVSKHGGENDKYKCQKCGKQLPRRGTWLYHEFSVCKIDHGEAFYKEQGITLLVCGVGGCPMKFINKRGWEEHIAAHTGSKDFICSRCGAAFSRTSGLKKHEREVDCTRDGYKAKNHKQSRLKRNHPCTLCPLKCMTIEGLAHHQNTMHDIDPPPGVDLVEEHIATCDECGITVEKDHIKRHIERVHKKIKNKSCPYCDKMFYNTNGLNGHIRLHHQGRDLTVQAESFLRENDDVQP